MLAARRPQICRGLGKALYAILTLSLGWRPGNRPGRGPGQVCCEVGTCKHNC
jgi:hypothetical protein